MWLKTLTCLTSAWRCRSCRHCSNLLWVWSALSSSSCCFSWRNSSSSWTCVARSMSFSQISSMPVTCRERERSLHLLEISYLQNCKLQNFLPPNTLICSSLSNSFSLNFLTCNIWLFQLPTLHHYIFLQNSVSLVIVAHLTHQHLASRTWLKHSLAQKLAWTSNFKKHRKDLPVLGQFTDLYFRNACWKKKQKRRK